MVLDYDFIDLMNTMIKSSQPEPQKNQSPSYNYLKHGSDMRKYEAYKDSGVEWMGELPNHWDKIRLAFVGKFLKGTGVSKADLADHGVPVILYGDIYTKYEIKTSTLQRFIPQNIAINSIEIMQGDILFAGSGETKEDIGKCVMYNGGEKAYAGGDVIIFRPKQLNSLYLSYVLNSEKVRWEKAKMGKGEIIVHIYSSRLRELCIPHPSIAEQTEIGMYLDFKTSQLDTLISKKEKLIELLKEERTAIINQAVTKGLDPDVPMRDSGIGWLGKIPEYWELKKIKHVNKKIGSGVTPKGGGEVYLESGIPLLRSQNVYFDGFKLDDVAFISEEIHNSMSGSKVYPSDVLINITGGSIGRCFYVTDEFDEANVNQHVCIVRPNSKIEPAYLYNLLRSNVGQLQIDICQSGGNRESLNFEQLENFFIPLPSIEDQRKILGIINKSGIEINLIISKTQQEIELLKEYKTALISEVVTGKVDVRSEL